MKRALVLLIFVFFSCEESYLPKQKAYLAHQFDKPLYKQTLSDCDYKFLINQKSKIKYNSNSRPGSLKNPYLYSGDFITIQKSNYGKISETITAITQPFLGVYTTKELYDSIVGN